MKKLPISAGILAWKSGQTLIDTLTTYYGNGLFDIVEEITILFQEFTETDKMIADHFGVKYISHKENIGIGKAFIELAEQATQPYFITLEHDWKLIETPPVTQNRLESGIMMLKHNTDVVRYRHRSSPGFPHFSFRHKGKELTYYDEEIGCTSPHLLDAIHWTEHPDISFSDYIQRDGDYYTTTSRYGNWTNNPCLYKKEFYINTVSPFVGVGIALEGNISRWWSQQNFKVAHGEGLFTHIDNVKYPR